MKRFLLTTFLLLTTLLPFLANPPKTYAVCDFVLSYTATPTTGTTTTPFTLAGNIQECANQVGASIRVFADSPSGGDPFSLEVDTDENGSFTVTNAIFPENGDWTLFVVYFGGPIDFANGVTSPVVRIGNAPTPTNQPGVPTVTPGGPTATTPPLACNDSCAPNSTACPASCPCAWTGQAQIWRCGGGVNCQTNLTSLSACLNNAQLSNPIQCSTSPVGYTCTSTLATMCKPPGTTDVKCSVVPSPTNPPAVPTVPTRPPAPAPPCSTPTSNTQGKCTQVQTAIGPINTEPATFIASLFSFILGISGGIAVLIIMYAGYLFLTSRGNAEAIQRGREMIVAAIVGLLFIIFSFVILETITGTVLDLPNFGP